MNTLMLRGAVAVTALVLFNAFFRQGSPSIDLRAVGLGEGYFHALASAFLLPGTYALWHLGLTLDSLTETVTATAVSWWTWLTVVRLPWSFLGRLFGFYSISLHHILLKASIPWRAAYRVWLLIAAKLRLLEIGDRATAGWAATLTLFLMLYKPGNSIYLGRANLLVLGLYQPVGIEGEGHAMLIGNTGSGKTRFLLGWLGSLHKDASAFVIDAGGQSSDVLAGPLEAAGHRVYVWDPFGKTKFESASWNLFDELTKAAERHGKQAVVRYAITMADALVVELNEKQQIFSAGARRYLAADILQIWLYEPPHRRTLVQLRRNLALGRPDLITDSKQDPFDAHLDDLIRKGAMDDGCGGAISAVIANGAGEMKSGKTREGNPFRTSALVATEFIDVPEVAATLQRSDFTVDRLKTHNDCLFLCAPVDDLRGKLSGFIRLLTTHTAYTFQHIPEERKIPCAMFLDEAPSVRIENLDVAAANYRKHSIRLVVATQDLPLLQAAYRDNWRTLLGSACVRIWLSNGELSTLKHLCEEVGTHTVTERVGGSSWLARALGLSKEPARYVRMERPLLYLQQARDLLDRDTGMVIATRTGKSAMILNYDPYDSALGVWQYDHDPKYCEPLFRSLTRRILAWLWVRKPGHDGPRLRMRVKKGA